jgi:hypothetical protein
VPGRCEGDFLSGIESETGIKAGGERARHGNE